MVKPTDVSLTPILVPTHGKLQMSLNQYSLKLESTQLKSKLAQFLNWFILSHANQEQRQRRQLRREQQQHGGLHADRQQGNTRAPHSVDYTFAYFKRKTSQTLN